MTKAELVEEVSRVSDLTKKHSEVIVETVFKSIIDALHRGEKIELRGFGSFRLRQREPRKGRNPKTGDRVDVPPKRVPYFKPGKELKELINRVSDLTKKHSEAIVDTVFQSIVDALHRGEKIELRGFGSFRLRQREPRKGRNPKTGDKVDVPPKKVPYFKPGKELKELINRSEGAEVANAAPDVLQA